MNKLIYLSLAAALLLTGCATNQQPTPTAPKPQVAEAKPKPKNIEESTSWIVNPSIDDGLGVVGVATKVDGYKNIMYKKALIDAESKMAALIKKEVSDKAKFFINEDKINAHSEVMQKFDDAILSVTKKVPLIGMQRVNLIYDENGNLFTHYVIKKKNLKLYSYKAKQKVKKEIEAMNLSKKDKVELQKAAEKSFDELKN
jgi:hypothetical protein